MSQVDFTLEDIKKVIDECLEQRLDERFVAEREYTRRLVSEEVRNEVGQQFDNFVRTEFRGFIENNFNPAMAKIDQHLDDLDDRVDRLTGDVAELRLDTRHIKHSLRTHRSATPASA